MPIDGIVIVDSKFFFMKATLLTLMAGFCGLFCFGQIERPARHSTFLDNYPNLSRDHDLSYWRNAPVAITTDADPVFYSGSSGDLPAPPQPEPVPPPGFSTITPLDPIPIGGIDTQHKPQAKTWFYAGKWWFAVPPSVGGT